MANRPNIVGQVFGRLTAVHFHSMRGKRRSWFCKCICGNTTVATTSDLRYGSVASCGCLLKGDTAANRRHGHSHREGPSPTYNSWSGMLERCGKPSHVSYKNYGGRGITVCERWKKFQNFLDDMGERPVGKSIDRVDPNGNYEPANCQWSTAVEQRRNRRDTRASSTEASS